MNIQRPFGLSIVVACCVFAAAQAQQPATTKPEPASVEAQAQQPYLLGPGDVLEVTIDQLDHPERRAQISGSGFVNLPLIGRVKAKCRTELQLQQDLTTAFDRYIKEPSISVLVLERNSRTGLHHGQRCVAWQHHVAGQSHAESCAGDGWWHAKRSKDFGDYNLQADSGIEWSGNFESRFGSNQEEPNS